MSDPQVGSGGDPQVGVVMGSDSDWPVMKAAAEALAEFDVAYEADVVSAHRMPEAMLDYGRTAADRGLAVIIAGAGGAAHLPGMLAAVTPLPVIGVPVPLKNLDGIDSLLSIVQMPAGVPVATVAIGNARNAGLLAVRVLAASDAALRRPDDRVPGRAAPHGGAEGRRGPVADGRPQGRLLTSGPSTSRLVGIDLARCLALLGMMATHVLRESDPDGTISFSQALAGGRASALFAVLAGLSLALMTGRTRPVRGRERLARSAGLAVRALLVALLGLVLGGLESGLAVILTYYGLLFLCGLPFLGLRARALFLLAGAWLLVAPVLSHLLRPHLPGRGSESPTFGQLADPGQLLGELLVTGYYPVLPWLTYLLVGMGLGRLDLTQRRVQATVAAVGAALAVLATVVSGALTRLDGVRTALVSDPPTVESPDTVLDRIDYGMFGTTPHRRCLAVAAGRRPALGNALRPRADRRERAASSSVSACCWSAR